MADQPAAPAEDKPPQAADVTVSSAAAKNEGSSKEKDKRSKDEEMFEPITEEASEEKMDKRAIEIVGDVIDVRRGSVAEAGVARVAKFLNTYKLEPDKPFNYEKVDIILENVMIQAFEDLVYDPIDCGNQAKWASNAIRAQVKKLECDRFKIISLVTIGEKHNQDVYCCCRFLWDYERDSFSQYKIENNHVFGYALCFGLYYE